jgi:hypothetical protein
MNTNLCRIKQARNLTEVLIHPFEPLEQVGMQESLIDQGRILARCAFEMNMQKAS